MGRFGAKRPQQTRNTLPIVLIVCDDSKAAPAYFEEVRSFTKGKCTIRVIPAPRHGASGSDVIQCAADEREQLTETAGTSVWAVIDLEMAHESDKTIKTLRDKAEKLGVIPAFSQPCFEVWVLAHFVDTGKRFDTCHAVLIEVKKHWEKSFHEEFPGKKAQADYRKLMDRAQDAIKGAKSRDALRSQSWTEIWRIVSEIIG